MNKKVTRTINPLHFSDLNPSRFEDLCLVLLSRITKWKELNHFGRSGNDSGIDIYGIESLNDREKSWFIQCKRYKKISKIDLDNIINSLGKSIPDKLLVIVSCDVSKTNYEYFKGKTKDIGIRESEIWTASTLEAKLYNEHKDLLFVYFDLKTENKTPSKEAQIRYSIKMKKRMRKDLINHEFMKEHINEAVKDPMLQFISNRVIIHSTEDEDYPRCSDTIKGKTNSWYREHLYDFYHNGIEIWLGATLGFKAIFDEKGYWQPILNFDDNRLKDTKYKVIYVKMIGRIPYYNIVDFKTSDEYYPDPHLYCKFNIDGEPYEKIYYRNYPDSKRDKTDYDWVLDEKKQTVFPK